MLAVVLFTAACAAPKSGRVERIEVPAPSLAGSILPNPETVPALVVLPPGYHRSARRYPVVFYLPGFTTDVAEYVDGTFDGFRLGEALDRTIALGRAREMVVVVVHGRNALGGSFYVNSPVTGRWEDHVLDDVIPHVESRYRVFGRPACRALAGESMGGTGALHLAMRRPEPFAAIFAISPGLFDERGLEDQGMLSPPYRAAWALQARRMRTWPATEAPARLAALGRELLAAQRFGYRRGFALAYAAAYAPAPDAGPPWVAYPYAEDGALDEPALARFRSGFGDLEQKVRRHAPALRALKIGLDVGSNDPLRWLPRGVRRFSALLDQAGIDHQVREHPGGHVDRLGDRIETQMLPFFTWESCDAQGASGGRP